MISTLFRFRSFLRRYGARLAAGVVFTLGSSIFALAQPWPLKVIVDSVLRGKPAHVPGFAFVDSWSKTELLNAAIAAYLAIVIFGSLFDYAGTYLMDASGVRMVADIREALFSRLQRLSLRFHASQRTGDQHDAVVQLLILALGVGIDVTQSAPYALKRIFRVAFVPGK